MVSGFSRNTFVRKLSLVGMQAMSIFSHSAVVDISIINVTTLEIQKKLDQLFRNIYSRINLVILAL